MPEFETKSHEVTQSNQKNKSIIDEKHHRAKLICSSGGWVEELDVGCSSHLTGWVDHPLP